jgi:DNA-binding response OmpR family regulator
MIITDWNLADGSGFDVLSIVRTSLDWPVPVVFVSVQNQENDIILALEHGADDYLVRPLRQREMLARLRALSRRCGIGPDHSHQHLTLGPYEIDADNNVITLNGESVALTEKEFKLATLLFQNINRALSRSHLLQSVWNLNEPIPTRTLDTHISSLRVKLNLIRETGLRLRSVYRYGYRLEQTGARPSPDKIRPAANGNTLRSEH